MNWMMLSSASKAVYPVIACHANKQGTSYPGEETISILAGLTPKRVRQGVRDLEGFPGFTWGHYTTKRGRRSKKFFLKLPQEPERGEAFPFHQAILETGNWRMLSPAGKALYPVMRHFSYFNIDEYLYLEDMEEEVSDFDTVYPDRKYEFCSAEKTILSQYAGISRRSINNALESLQKCHLVETEMMEDEDNVHGCSVRWKVFLRDNGMLFRRDFLNQQMVGKNYRS